jgi:hypothetical protein
MKTPLIKCRVCHNVKDEYGNELNHGWHDGWRLENSETVAFYYKKKWYASVPGLKEVAGPFNNMETALEQK